MLIQTKSQNRLIEAYEERKNTKAEKEEGSIRDMDSPKISLEYVVPGFRIESTISVIAATPVYSW